jgi:protein dithiol oxidoreductase (disulfide-forming)
MKRRHFSSHLSTCLVGAGLLGNTQAWAAGPPSAASSVPSSVPMVPAPPTQALVKTEFGTLTAPVSTTPGKIEVLEFFMYSCPHCFHFEPAVDAWRKNIADDVAFKQVPVAFRPHLVIHQRLFYALEALGKLKDLHTKVFNAIHQENNWLDSNEKVLAFAVKNGLNSAQFKNIWGSVSITAKANQAMRLSERYKLTGVPTLAIHGRFITSPAQAKSPERTLQVTDALIKKARQGA